MDGGFLLSLDAGSFKVIGLLELEMDASTVLLTNESITATPQIHSLCKVKLEVDDVVVLSDSDEDNIQVVDIAGTSSNPFQAPCSFASTSSVQAPHSNESAPYKPLSLNVYEQHIRSKKTSCLSYVIDS